ncbi:MAG: hypothetical protein M3441_11595 [Chloroflexota bacterium]|nr:hypothetical protein [Chloroflexota bacterium]
MKPISSNKMFSASVAVLMTSVLLLMGVNPAGKSVFAGTPQEPANKFAASGSSTEVAGPGQRILLLNEQVKTSKPTDLVFGVTLECSITTDVTTVGSETQQAFGQVRVWVEVDGRTVPVSQDDPDSGKVVFCNRTYQRTTQLGSDDETDAVRTFMETRTANGFNWMLLNAGSAVHQINVYAEFTTAATPGSSALAVVGNRTLIVEPVKAERNEVVVELGN